MKNLRAVFLSIIFTALGLLGGWYASSQTSKGAVASAEGEHVDEGGRDAAKPQVRLSVQALKNLGVETSEIDTSTYHRYRAVPAVVTETLKSTQPLVAPVGGVIADIKINPGAMVGSGRSVLNLVREAIVRPTLSLTDHIIQPASDQIHTSLSELRKALRGLEILKTELQRISKYTEAGDGLAILPKKTEIDLRYEIARAEQEAANAREKLRLHGLSDEQVGEIEKGRPLPTVNSAIWKRALERNGLWNAPAEKIYPALPADVRETAWVVAALGELVGAGLATDALANWLVSDKEAAADFLVIAALLQQGHSLLDVQALKRLNALDQVVEIEAPSFNEVQDWDVHEILVKPLEHVQAGTKLAVLLNHRELLLKTEPVGGETGAVLKALTDASEIEAIPAVEGVGQRLKGLKLAYVTSDEHAGTIGYVRAKNEALHIADGPQGKFRTWQLRTGQRFVLRIPGETFKDVYVVKAEAVVEDGPDKIVFVQNGDAFEPRRVAVRYQDHENAALDSKHSDLFPGDLVVQKGAFDLSMALKATTGGPVDPHAGHNH